MTLDYTKLFRWQEAGSQGSFHVGMDRQPMRARLGGHRYSSWVLLGHATAVDGYF